MFNRVIMVGNLTRDPELRYTPQGTAVATIGLAVNSSYKSSDEKKDEVLFIDVVVWSKLAETCSQYLNKGRQILVEGRLQERRWETDGQKRSKMEIVAQSVKFLGGKRDDASAAPGGSSGESSNYGGTPPSESSDIEPF
jgi:single-strand DNA-binding protein